MLWVWRLSLICKPIVILALLLVAVLLNCSSDTRCSEISDERLSSHQAVDLYCSTEQVNDSVVRSVEPVTQVVVHLSRMLFFSGLNQCIQFGYIPTFNRTPFLHLERNP